jgi:hypothetical protein
MQKRRCPGGRSARGARVLIDAAVARKVGLEAAKGMIGQPASIVDYEEVPYDQFTLGQGPRDQPFHRFTFDDPDRTAFMSPGRPAGW